MLSNLRYLILLMFLGVYSELWATHIVGGDFYYRYISNNRYEITMKLYIDCENGQPGAISSDAEAIVSVWDGLSYQYESKFTMTRTSPTRLNKLQYKCVIPEQGVCVDQYVYVKTITLNPGANGKILSFQRCCRNNSINNIVFPESTGATYWVKVPGTNTVLKDNSPQFKELPPNYICTNAPLIFDHSATDTDGDSLVYELYNPFTGATKENPRPDNTFGNGMFDKPPFEGVIWKSPYSTNNQLGGNPLMEIDSKTGLLTATPTVEGQFVIGIKVKEYRNGLLIGETLRDYQFNVRPCKFDIVSAFVAPIYACSDTVKFTNRSYKATNYTWNFGDPSCLDDTSNQVEPFYVYPGNGTYTVTLTARNSVCEDVYYTTVKVKSKIEFNLGPDDTTCFKVDKYLNTFIFDATKTQWSTGEFGPYIKATKPGEYIATVYYGNCYGKDTVAFTLDPPTYYLTSDSIYCDSIDGFIEVNPMGRADIKCKWNNSPKDTFFYYNVSTPGMNYVEITNKWCTIKDSIELWLSNKPQIGPYLFVCNEFDKQYDGGDFRDATYLWSDGSTNRFKNISQAGKHWVQVTQRNCVNSDTIFIENPIIPLELGNDRHYCDSFTLELASPPFMRSYLWSTGSTNQKITVNKEGKYTVFLVDTNGCERADSLYIDVTESPSIFIGDDTTICYRSEVNIGIDAPFLKYQWNNGESTSRILVQQFGNYVLTVTDDMGCTGTDSLQITVDPNALPNELFFPNAFSPNQDGLNDLFPYSITIPQPEYTVKIFNRWGEKLFDSQMNNSQHWDGMYKGGKLRPEAYVYLIEYRGCDGNYRRASGTVTLLK